MPVGGVPPSRFVCFQVGVDAGAEGHCLSSFEPGRRSKPLSVFDRINAVEPELAGSQCFLAGFGEGYVDDRPQAHIPLTVAGTILIDP